MRDFDFDNAIVIAALFIAGLAMCLLNTGCSHSSPRSDAYFVGHVAAAELRVSGRKTAAPAKGVAPPEALGAIPDGVDYQVARKEFNDNKKPMLIIVHAEWCGPCNRMISRSLPRVKNLDQVNLVFVDIDTDPALKKKLTEADSVPQVILFYYDKEGVARKKQESGAKSAEELEEFIANALNLPKV